MSLTAVIPAAGRGLKPYPAWDSVHKQLHPIVDRDGVAKPVLQILAEDAFAAGCDRIVLVVSPGEDAEYRHLLRVLAETMQLAPASSPQQRTQGIWLEDLLDRLQFAIQEQPLGLGHALWCARALVRSPRFLVMLSDHLPLSHAQDHLPCAQQLLQRAANLPGPVSLVEPLPEHLLHRYGVAAGVPVSGDDRLWTVSRLIEKPSPTQAELELETPGLRRGEYLGLSCMHLLPVEVLDRIDEHLATTQPGAGDLTPVLDAMARSATYHALRVEGVHQDIGTAFGLIEAQIERALIGLDRERMLAQLVDIFARDARREGRRR